MMARPGAVAARAPACKASVPTLAGRTLTPGRMPNGVAPPGPTFLAMASSSRLSSAICSCRRAVSGLIDATHLVDVDVVARADARGDVDGVEVDVLGAHQGVGDGVAGAAAEALADVAVGCHDDVLGVAVVDQELRAVG